MEENVDLKLVDEGVNAGEEIQIAPNENPFLAVKVTDEELESAKKELDDYVAEYQEGWQKYVALSFLIGEDDHQYAKDITNKMLNYIKGVKWKGEEAFWVYNTYEGISEMYELVKETDKGLRVSPTIIDTIVYFIKNESNVGVTKAKEYMDIYNPIHKAYDEIKPFLLTLTEKRKVAEGLEKKYNGLKERYYRQQELTKE